MKRVFCDHCGEEMDYGKMPDILNNCGTTVVTKAYSRSGAKALRAMVRIHIDFDKENGKHADICKNCRVAVIQTALTAAGITKEES